MKALLRQLFYVRRPDHGTGDEFYRLSLTKTGSAIKSFSVVVGGAISGTTLLMQNTKASLIVAMVFAGIGAIGAWLQDCGKRNAMN